MNNILAMIMVLPLAVLGFVVHTCGGLLALVWLHKYLDLILKLFDK